MTQLRANPSDCFSAAVLLETAEAASEDLTVRVEQAIKPFMDDSEIYALLRIKAARNWLPSAWPTAIRRVYSDSWHGTRAETYYAAMLSRKLKNDDINSAMADLARIYHRSGDAEDIENMQAALRILSERNSPNLKALRTELERSAPEKMTDYSMVDGRPAPILPKGLTWASLNKYLNLEGGR